MLTKTPSNNLSFMPTQNKPEAVKKSLWGYGIAIVYTIFALGTLGVVAFTMRQKIELVATDYYASEMSYEQQINRVRQARDLTIPVICHVTDDSKFIQIQFPAELQPVRGNITLYRPADSSLDVKIAAQPDKQGVQLISTAKLAHGNWHVKITWTAEGREFYNEFPLNVQ